jgi:calcineurin-like phosphoesterase family protein
MIWFLSDTHYHHKNIVRGVSAWTDKSGCRDCTTLEAHDSWVLDSINRYVGRQDILWHLGDWSFGGKDKIKEFRDQINCERVHLVLGNHDHHIAQQGAGLLFESVQPYKELDLKGQQLVLCHYPIESWNSMERGAKHLHGHVHGEGQKIAGRYDVGMDALGLMYIDQIAKLPKATSQRHALIEGGNKFA